MSLAEAAAYAKANAGHSRRASGREVRNSANKEKPAEKSLVEMHAETKAKAKVEGKKKGDKAEWAASHPWKPFNRETDLDVRLTKPKGKESILNNEFMGSIDSRFGNSVRMQTFM